MLEKEIMHYKNCKQKKKVINNKGETKLKARRKDEHFSRYTQAKNACIKLNGKNEYFVLMIH